MQTRMQGAPLCVDSCNDEAGLQRSVDVVHHLFGFLHDSQHLAVAEPAGVGRLASALGMENGRLHNHGELLFVRGATEHFQLGRQVVVGKKQALGHHLHPHQGSVGSINSAQMGDNPLNYQWTCAS